MWVQAAPRVLLRALQTQRRACALALCCLVLLTWTLGPSRHGQPAPPANVSIEIHVIANNRLNSLQRMLASLMACGFDTRNVPLTFHIEADQAEDVLGTAEAMPWENKHIAARLTQGGLINAVAESWQPSARSERLFALFLEDDVVLAPDCASYAYEMGGLCASDTACAGFSLYTPRVDELNPKHVRRNRTEFLRALRRGGDHYRQQLPNSWGAVYKAKHWAEFREWLAARIGYTEQYHLQVPLGTVVGWSASWKKFMLELMLLKGWYLFYPNFEDQASLSTNMLEPGEHIVKNDRKHTKEMYTVPLLKRPPRAPASRNAAPLLDSYDNPVAPFTNKAPAVDPGKRRERNRCADYNAELHKRLIADRANTTTVVMSYMHTPGDAGTRRHEALGLLVRHYCSMACVSRVVVVWHSLVYAPPPTSTCPGSNNTLVMFEHFARDSLLNRFAPSELILTPSYITTDDDMLVDEGDVQDMLQLWSAERHKIVGPFARWISPKGEYAYSFKKVPDQSYSVVLTKFHISATLLMNRIYCANKYRMHRKFVDKYTNSEDLLYIRAGIDQFHRGNPSLLYRTEKPIIDFGSVGLHSRNNHNRQRTEALSLFGLLDATLLAHREANRQNHNAKYRHSAENVIHLASVDDYPV